LGRAFDPGPNAKADQRKGSQADLDQKQAIHLAGVPIMQEVENPQRKGFASWRDEEEQGFSVPKAQKIGAIPCKAQDPSCLRQECMPDTLYPIEPVQSRKIAKCWIQSLLSKS